MNSTTKMYATTTCTPNKQTNKKETKLLKSIAKGNFLHVKDV